jgi:RimJ/RimL family protein N-acetyltransferase
MGTAIVAILGYLRRATRASVQVKQLSQRDRRRVLRHFLALDAGDRLLRFGTVLPDERIVHYVEGIDFGRDTVYGVHNYAFRIVAVGHLAFAPTRDGQSTSKANVAEFGVSVSKSARGLGIGSKLFERAAIRCRNMDVDTLYMHCLASNKVMMRIARKAGMEVEKEFGEADAYLRLLPADPASVMREALDEQAALIDYTVKANVRALAKLLGLKRGR